ncbi:CinA family protein [Nisaea acidiphila]|uniref:CinA family protein n=1 Tax=Nisaea acidiphila TaxID=1862145 RepID=A0A9J7AS68_9PROT|nr:CinA family protein [Nisaea acidiphila]UUX50192.1 CinA family protein [Nisaea acidiphila]
MDNFDTEIRASATQVLNACRKRGWKAATAESCTGGLIAGALTEIAGSSDVVDRGFVTYSNEAKMGMLDVPEQTLATHGAVSEPTARAMAEGALANSLADVTVAVTGVAGPGGGSVEKPVGLVHFAAATNGKTISDHRVFDGDRGSVRHQTVLHALGMLRALAEG